MKEYHVPVTKSDKVFTVKAYWKADHDLGSQVDSFANEKEAIEHAQWWTNKSLRRNQIQSVEVTQTIRLVVAK